jgi:hypothetical protein
VLVGSSVRITCWTSAWSSMFRPAEAARTSAIRSSTASGGKPVASCVTPSAFVRPVPERPTVSARSAANRRSRRPLPPTKIGGRGRCIAGGQARWPINW